MNPGEDEGKPAAPPEAGRCPCRCQRGPGRGASERHRAMRGRAGGFPEAQGFGGPARWLLPSSSSSDVMDLERSVRAVVGARFGGGGAAGQTAEAQARGQAWLPRRPRRPTFPSSWGGGQPGACGFLPGGLTGAGKPAPSPLHSIPRPQQALGVPALWSPWALTGTLSGERGGSLLEGAGSAPSAAD